MKQFDRQYKFAAGQAGGSGFEVNGLHIDFQIQQADVENPNVAKIRIWNLSPSHLATLDEKDCAVTLKAGYGTRLPLVFAGHVSFVQTSLDGSDRMTEIEAVDGRVALRDTYVSLSYNGKISTRKITEDTAGEMGLSLVLSYNAPEAFVDFPHGFAFAGQAKKILDKVCLSSGLSWSIHNGILHVKRKKDVMTREVFLLSKESGLVGIPKRTVISAEDPDAKEQIGWEIEYFMNAAIGVGDYIRLESAHVAGYFRVYSVDIEGDNLEGSWLCTARLLDA
jgi:hypothetical protein